MQKNFIERFLYPKDANPFPGLRLIVLFLFMMLDSINMSMLFAFLPRLVKFFGATELDAGYHAGVIATGFFMSRAFFSFIWGYLADLYGRKKCLMVTSICLSVFTMCFGLSRSFYMGLLTRILQGSCAGIDVCCMAILTEISDETNASFGMSVLTSSFSAGMVIGPCIGGFLAFPDEQVIDFFPYEPLLNRFPILLPQMITSLALLLVSLIGFFVLSTNDVSSSSCDESTSLRSKGKYRYRYYTLGDQSTSEKSRVTVSTFRKADRRISFGEFLLTSRNFETSGHEDLQNDNNKINQAVRMLRSKNFLSICVVYAGFSFYGVGFDELFPLFASTKQKYGGFGFDTEEIGLLFTVVGSVLVIFNVFVTPKIVQGRCPKKCFTTFAILQSISVAVFPIFGKMTGNAVLFWVAMSLLLLLLRVCMTGCYVTMNLTVCNLIEKKQHGMANGIAFAFSCFGRSLAPTTIGSIYSWSLTNISTVDGEKKEGLGFPFNNFFAFYILSTVIMTCALAMIVTSRKNENIVS